MTDEPETPEDLTPAERRVLELVAAVRTEAEGPGELDPRLQAQIMRSARVQHLLRNVVPAVDDLVLALGDGLMILAGGSRRNRRSDDER